MNALDINIYFQEKYRRLCVLASAGGALPKYLLDDNSLELDEDNISNINYINKALYEFPKNFKIGRNPILPNILKYQYPDIYINENIDEDYNFTSRYNMDFELLDNNEPNTNLDHSEFSDYFSNFDDLASKGFFVYDKLNINYPEDDNFILVSYPIYDNNNIEHRNFYNEIRSYLEFSPKLRVPIIERYSNTIHKNSFKTINLIELLNST
ncbi:hypothetical protein [Acinetobacter nosocomialis]|uniref:hypothetical protein n=1 Tax=Acinetobacter nosocomialis TaxID=106654 RepID=UPI003004CE18